MKDSWYASLVLLGLLLGAIIGFFIQKGTGILMGGGIGLVIGGTLVDLYRRRKGKQQQPSEEMNKPASMDVNVEEFRSRLWHFQQDPHQ